VLEERVLGWGSGRDLSCTNRYSVDINFDKNKVNKEAFKDKSTRRRARTDIKQKLEERYKTGKNKWFFTKLRF